MRITDFGQVTIDVRKLENYCLNPSHPRGRHKARVFQNALGLGRGDAAWLRDRLLGDAPAAEATLRSRDRFGAQLQADVRVARQNRSAVVRTIWIVQEGRRDVRLVTCWVL